MSGYAEIAEHYRDKIKMGDLRPGEAMPTVTEVSKAHGVARNTAARVFAVLKTEGLIIPRAGAGTVVAASKSIISGADRLNRLARTGRRYGPGEDSVNHQVMIRSVAGSPRISEALGLSIEDEAVIRIRVFRQDGKPTTVGFSIIHPRALADVPEIAQEGRLPKFWQEIFTKRTGRSISRGQRTVMARQATREEIDALEIQAPPYASVAVLVTHQTFHDEDGAIEHWEDVYAPGYEIDLTP